MAGDFQSVKAELVTRVVNTHPSTASLMAAAMVDQLLTLQPEAMPFMEVSGSFSTVAGKFSYSAKDTEGFPRGFLRFDRLYYDLGSYTIDLVSTDRTLVRRLEELGPTSYPYQVAWIGESLHFGPPPSGVFTVKWDGLLDSTKDSETGDLIDTTATTATNPWLTDGVVPYRHLVLAQYYLTSPDQRADLAQQHQQAAALAISSMRQTQAQRLQLGGIYQIPSAYDRRPEGDRRQIIFPGAPI